MSKSWGENRDEALRRCGQKPPQTNADRIRAMTDEELATLCQDGCPPHHHCPDWCGETGIKELCQRCWLDWLRREASDGP